MSDQFYVNGNSTSSNESVGPSRGSSPRGNTSRNRAAAGRAVQFGFHNGAQGVVHLPGERAYFPRDNAEDSNPPRGSLIASRLASEHLQGAVNAEGDQVPRTYRMTHPEIERRLAFIEAALEQEPDPAERVIGRRATRTRPLTMTPEPRSPDSPNFSEASSVAPDDDDDSSVEYIVEYEVDHSRASEALTDLVFHRLGDNLTDRPREEIFRTIDEVVDIYTHMDWAAHVRRRLRNARLNGDDTALETDHNAFQQMLDSLQDIPLIPTGPRILTSEHADAAKDVPADAAQCPICMENYPTNVNTRDNTMPVELKVCGHMFHYECIDDWINQAHSTSDVTCPCCRARICASRRRAVGTVSGAGAGPDGNGRRGRRGGAA